MYSLPTLGFIFTLLLGSTVQAHTLTTAEKQADFHALVATIESGYGPLHYKTEFGGLDRQALVTQYESEVIASKTNADYYYTIVRFVAAFHDAHFSAWLPTSRMASLPFSVDWVNGKILIDSINREELPESVFPFQKGDEILMWNGHPAVEEAQALAQYLGSGTPLSTFRKAVMSLPLRAARTFPLPEEKEVALVIQRGSSQLSDTTTVSWTLTGRGVDESADWLTILSSPPLRNPHSRNYDQLSLNAFWKDLPVRSWERSYRCSGTTRVEIPSSATVLMKEPFVAYYWNTEKGSIGYLRIPHYFPENPVTGEPEYDLRFSQYEYAVSELEKHTVGLVIDQDHNCGGSVDYLHRIASLFVTQDFTPAQFQLLANKQEYLDFQKWSDSISAHTLEGQGVLKVLELIRTTWKSDLFMTPKTSLNGIPAFHPHSIHYTKPIVMLVDELSGSGGDAFPALLQGHGRATLIGTQTMGAGGHVEEQPALPYSRLSFRMTKSLFFRPDGVAVENNGVTPDIPYTPTREDFMYGYRPYREFYTQKLLEKIAASNP